MSVPTHAVHYLEIVTPDVAAVCAMYQQTHGWQFAQVPALGGAFVAELPDGSRCGIRAPLRASEAPVVRPYVRVDDLAAAVRQAEAAGATIALAGMELPGHGTIAIYLLGGIDFGLWQLP